MNSRERETISKDLALGHSNVKRSKSQRETSKKWEEKARAANTAKEGECGGSDLESKGRKCAEEENHQTYEMQLISSIR